MVTMAPSLMGLPVTSGQHDVVLPPLLTLRNSGGVVDLATVIPLSSLTLFTHTQGSLVESLFLILSHDVWVLTQNQDQDTRRPHSTLVDLLWTL